jgi:hypothetical protein
MIFLWQAAYVLTSQVSTVGGRLALVALGRRASAANRRKPSATLHMRKISRTTCDAASTSCQRRVEQGASQGVAYGYGLQVTTNSLSYTYYYSYFYSCSCSCSCSCSYFSPFTFSILQLTTALYFLCHMWRSLQSFEIIASTLFLLS